MSIAGSATQSTGMSLGSSLSISDFAVRKIPMAVGRAFIKQYHYSGGCALASMTWGLFNEPTNELLGVIAFHTPISENVRCSIFEQTPYNEPDPENDGGNRVHEQNVCGCDHVDGRHGYRAHVTELHRLVTKDKCPHNTETWFISRGLDGLKDYKPKYWAVVSFADQTEGHQGTIYQASNALYYGSSRKATFYLDEENVLRPPRNDGDNITVEEAVERGWKPVERESKHRYLFLLPDPYGSKEELRAMVEVDTEGYPGANEAGGDAATSVAD